MVYVFQHVKAMTFNLKTRAFICRYQWWLLVLDAGIQIGKLCPHTRVLLLALHLQDLLVERLPVAIYEEFTSLCKALIIVNDQVDWTGLTFAL